MNYELRGVELIDDATKSVVLANRMPVNQNGALGKLDLNYFCSNSRRPFE